MPQTKRFTPYGRPTSSNFSSQETHPKSGSRDIRGSISGPGSQASRNRDRQTSQASKSQPNHQASKKKKIQNKSTFCGSKRSNASSSRNPISQQDIRMFNGTNDGNHDSHGTPDSELGSDDMVNKDAVTDHMQSPLPDDEGDLGLLTSHMSGLRLQSFNRMATRADLDEEDRIIGRRLCNVTTPVDQFHAIMVTVLSMRKETNALSNSMAEVEHSPTKKSPTRSATTSWEDQDNRGLKGALRTQTWKSILDGDVQAYTAKEDSNKVMLTSSLFAKVIAGILSHSKAWKKQCLPPGYGVDPDVKSTCAFTTMVNNVLKEVRKDFEGILLTNIYLPDRSNVAINANVPTLDGIIIQLYQKQHSYVGGKVLAEGEILKKVGHLQRCRYAWLRMQAIHWGLNRKSSYGIQTLWNVVDDQLDTLRTHTRQFRYAFFISCLHCDLSRISGRKNLAQLKKETSFSLPTQQEIEAAVRDLNKTHGEDSMKDEMLYEEDQQQEGEEEQQEEEGEEKEQQDQQEEEEGEEEEQQDQQEEEEGEEEEEEE
ncbi:hypothetical protein DFH28DRAFT_1159837 [Melampsora americana]|nr:hypothetical protein DFH28DRAFT_1159837 [Melampsora americana]